MNPRFAAPQPAAGDGRLVKAMFTSLAMCTALLWPAAASASPLSTFNGSASIGNLRISVVDLDLNDGIAAGYSVIDPNGYRSVAGAVVDYFNVPLIDTQRGSTNWGATSLHANATVPNSEAHASINAGVATVRVAASGYSYGAYAEAAWDTYYFSGGGFPNWLLAPHTRLTLAADAELTIDYTGCAVVGCSSTGDVVTKLHALLLDTGTVHVTFADDSMEFLLLDDYDGLHQQVFSAKAQRTLTITLDNLSDQATLVRAFLFAYAGGSSDATAPSDLPEPNSLALVALCAAALWRRRAKAPLIADRSA